MNLSDRMKLYEKVESARRFTPLLPVLARLDGKGFSKFTKGLKRPYDERLTNLIIEVCKFLAQETNACCTYQQSDEITLAWHSNDIESQIYFDGRVQKMTSVLAAKCSVRFNTLLSDFIPEKAELEPVFDCRVWSVPTLEEAANSFLDRELDATKNSITMAAGEYYSHKELMNKNSSEKQEMLWQKQVNWNDYPSFFKRGTYIQRKKIYSKITPEELENLPPLHNARKNPDLEVERTEYHCLELPPLNKIANKVDVIFNGAQPILNG